jgi:DNA polymerase (family 10)
VQGTAADILAFVAKALPRNDEIADQLDLLADIMELEAGDYFRVQAYRKAATRIRETAVAVAQLALDGKATQLAGIGKTIEEKIVEVVELGEMRALTKRKELVPPEVVSFMRLPGLGPKTARRIWQELGVTTLAGLKEAAEGEQLRALGGLGAKSEEKILKALSELSNKPDGAKRVLLGRALPPLKAAVEELRAHPAAEKVTIAGSARRYRETVRDLDIIATATDPEALVEAFTNLDFVAAVVAKGGTKGTIVSQEGFRFDLRVVPPECYGNLLQHFSGSKQHNVALREDAVRRGLSISEYGVTEVESGTVHTFDDEEALYEFLGYAYIAPELRENAGELEAARAGALPQLVEVGDLRGDLHLHTTWSADGKGTLEQMVQTAIARGYDYLAITDHSHYLRDGRLEAQAVEIEKLRKRVEPFRVLRGIEVNIRADGTLDVLDEQLVGLDWVVASVHSAREKDPTERVLAAMDHPHVDLIGHLTGRKIGKRGPVDIDLEQVFAKALETKTFLEINSQPDRLDLRDSHARAAAEAGVPLCVDSDGHSTGALAYVELGIGQARRGWVTKEQVVNTRSWAGIERMRKRG